MPVSTFSADGWITSQSIPLTTNTSEPFDYLGSTVTKFAEEEAEAAYVGEPINPIARIVFLVAAWTIAIVGVVGSSSLLYMIHKHWRKSNHNVFIASLTLADLLILGYWWPYFCVDLIIGFHPVADMFHCQVNAVIGVTLSLVYVTSLIMVTLNRFMLVCHAHRYEQCFSPKTTALGVIALWVGSIASAIIPIYSDTPRIYRYDTITRTCTFKKPRQSYLSSLFIVLYFAVPLCLIGFFNFRIYRFWNRANVKLAHRCSTIDPPSTDCPTRKGSISLQEKGKRQTESASKLSRIDEKSFACIEDTGTVQTPKRTCCEPSSTCRCHLSSPTNKFTIRAAAGTFLYDSPSAKTTRRSVSSVGASYQPRQTELKPAFTIESSPDASTPNTPVPRAATLKPGPSRCRTSSPLSPSYCTKLRRPSTSAITSASDPGKKRNSSSIDDRTEITKRTARSSAESQSQSVKTFSIPVISTEEPRPLPSVLPFLGLTQERDHVSFKSRADTKDTDRASSIVSSTINPRAKSLWLPADTGAQSGCSSATASRKGSVKTVDIEDSGSPGFKKKKEDSKAPKRSSLAKGNKNKNANLNMDFFRDEPSNLGGSLSSDVIMHPTYPRPFSMMMLHYQAPETSTQSEGTDPQQSQLTQYQKIKIDIPNDHISITQNSQKMRILDSDVDSSMCGKKSQRISRGSVTRFTSSAAILIPTRTSLKFLAAKRRFLGTRDSGQRKYSVVEQRIAAVTERIGKREKAVVRSLLAVSLLAAIAFIPYGVVHLVGQCVDFPPELYISVNLFFCLNSALNWVVYGVMNPSFRDSYRHMFQRLCPVCADTGKFIHTPGPKVSVQGSLSPVHVRDIFYPSSLSNSGLLRSRSPVNIGIRGLAWSAGALTFPAREVSLSHSCVDCDNCGHCRASPCVDTKV